MLLGRGIYLRDLIKEDIEIVYELCGEAEVMKYNGGQADKASILYFKERFKIFSKPGKKIMVIVNNKKEIIGYIDYEINRYTVDVYSIGISIGKKYWGQGYGSEAVKILIQHLFMKKRAHKIELEVVCENLRAIKCYKKCGFVEEGRLRSKYYLNGKYLDTVIFGLTIDDYKNEKRSVV